MKIIRFYVKHSAGSKTIRVPHSAGGGGGGGGVGRRGGAWLLALFDFSSSYAFHQEAASLNNNSSQLAGKLIPNSRQTGLVQSRLISTKKLNSFPFKEKHFRSDDSKVQTFIASLIC